MLGPEIIRLIHMKKCPSCSALVKQELEKCIHCGEVLVDKKKHESLLQSIYDRVHHFLNRRITIEVRSGSFLHRHKHRMRFSEGALLALILIVILSTGVTYASQRYLSSVYLRMDSIVEIMREQDYQTHLISLRRARREAEEEAQRQAEQKRLEEERRQKEQEEEQRRIAEQAEEARQAEEESRQSEQQATQQAEQERQTQEQKALMSYLASTSALIENITAAESQLRELNAKRLDGSIKDFANQSTVTEDIWNSIEKNLMNLEMIQPGDYGTIHQELVSYSRYMSFMAHDLMLYFSFKDEGRADDDPELMMLELTIPGWLNDAGIHYSNYRTQLEALKAELKLS